MSNTKTLLFFIFVLVVFFFDNYLSYRYLGSFQYKYIEFFSVQFDSVRNLFFLLIIAKIGLILLFTRSLLSLSLGNIWATIYALFMLFSYPFYAGFYFFYSFTLNSFQQAKVSFGFLSLIHSQFNSVYTEVSYLLVLPVLNAFLLYRVKAFKLFVFNVFVIIFANSFMFIGNDLNIPGGTIFFYIAPILYSFFYFQKSLKLKSQSL